MMSRVAHLVFGTVASLVICSCPPHDDPSHDPTPSSGDGSFAPTLIGIREVGESDEDTLFVLEDEALTFTDGEDLAWTAPRGTLTDGASIPRLLLSVTDGRFDRSFLKAAVVHDAYCQTENEELPQYHSRTWQAVHRMFYEACLACGASQTLAGQMYAAVLLGGPRWDEPERDLEPLSAEVRQIGLDGCVQFIEDSKPGAEEIDRWVEKREPVLLEVNELERDAREALQRGDRREADALRQRTEVLLQTPDRSDQPVDLTTLRLEAYFYNGWLAHSPDPRSETAVLDRAERTYRSLIEEDPLDPGALLGLARVSEARDKPEAAEEFAERLRRVRPPRPPHR